jgi:hypothetical protein
MCRGVRAVRTPRRRVDRLTLGHPPGAPGNLFQKIPLSQSPRLHSPSGFPGLPGLVLAVRALTGSPGSHYVRPRARTGVPLRSVKGGIDERI